MTPQASKPSRPTIYHVAEHAGVSITTVSRVLNGSQNVAGSTRKSVLSSMRQLQYRPHRAAKSLAQRSTQTLAVAMPSFITPFHTALLTGMRSRLSEVEVDLLLCDVDWRHPERALRKFLFRGVLDGLLIAGLSIDEELAVELEQVGAPVALIGAQWPSIDSFYWDEHDDARQAIRHLVDQGHERIGMITTHHTHPIRHAHLQAYRSMLRAEEAVEHALIACGQTREHNGFSEEAGFEAMQQLLQVEPPVTAVFASSDVHAIGAWQAIRQSGRTVPDDMALIGCNDVKVSQFMGLSSMDRRLGAVGAAAVDALLKRLEGGQHEPTSMCFNSTLKVRKTTATTSDDVLNT